MRILRAYGVHPSSDPKLAYRTVRLTNRIGSPVSNIQPDELAFLADNSPMNILTFRLTVFSLSSLGGLFLSLAPSSAD